MGRQLALRYGRVGVLLVAGALALIWTGASGTPLASLSQDAETNRATLDPAAWGSDHVGQPLPDYVTGDECLFCHRVDVGPSWPENRHQLTMRLADRGSPALRGIGEATPQVAQEIQVVIGGEHAARFLKPSGAYGQYSLLGTAWIPAAEEAGGKLVHAENPTWDDEKFGRSCAGCHASAVDSASRAFSSPSLDCYTCHGIVDLGHTKDVSLVLLSKTSRDPAPVVMSICAQCHVRTGRSRSSGLPYPNNFVPGDNLFRDFEVDLSEEALALLNPIDRHVLENVREVVLYGEENLTCLSCHLVHNQSSKKHRGLREEASCYTCHNRDGPMAIVKEYVVHSETCEY